MSFAYAVAGAAADFSADFAFIIAGFDFIIADFAVVIVFASRCCAFWV